MAEQHNFKYETNCDVECIIRLFAEGGIEHVVQNLDGVFAFILIDKKNQRVYAGRDPFGVRPLFRLKTEAGIVAFSSEGKGK